MYPPRRVIASRLAAAVQVSSDYFGEPNDEKVGIPSDG
jgi:hypothetical protein